MEDCDIDYIIETENGKQINSQKNLDNVLIYNNKEKLKNLKLKIPKIKKRVNKQHAKSTLKIKTKKSLKYKRQKTTGSAQLKLKKLSNINPKKKKGYSPKKKYKKTKSEE